MNGKACMTVARRLVRVLFPALRAGLLGQLIVADPIPNGGEQIVLTRDELNIMVATAVDDGWRRGFAAGQGLDTPVGLLSVREDA